MAVKPSFGGPAKGKSQYEFVRKPPRGDGMSKLGVTSRPGQPAKEVVAAARDVAKRHAVAMAELMVKIANDPEVAIQTRLDAAAKLIDRAEGKPAQAIGGDPNGVPVRTVVSWEPPSG